MADESCFSTAGLAHSLHVTLPIFTELGREGTTFNLAQLNTGDIGFLVDYYLRSVSWGLLVVLVGVLLLFLAALQGLCVFGCCCCHGQAWSGGGRDGGGRGEHRPRWKSLRWGCGCISILLALFCLPLVGVGFWAEIKLSEVVLEQTHKESIVVSQQSVYSDVETKRHWIVMAQFVLITCATLGTLIAIVIATAYKRLPPLLTMLVVLFVVALLTSLIAGAGFSFLLFLGDLCVSLSTPAQSNFCTDETAEAWTLFCGSVYMYGFIVFVIFCALLLSLTVLIMLAATYSATINSGVRSSRVSTDTQPSAPPPRVAAHNTVFAPQGIPERRFFVGGTSAVPSFSHPPTGQPRYSVPSSGSIPMSPLIGTQDPGQNRLSSAADAPPRYEEVEHRLSTAEEEMEDHVTIETPSTMAENQDEESSL